MVRERQRDLRAFLPRNHVPPGGETMKETDDGSDPWASPLIELDDFQRACGALRMAVSFYYTT